MPKDFFTPQRLKGYRDLHVRYPLWCGDWQKAELQKPESMLWLVRTLLEDEAGRLVKGARLVMAEFGAAPSHDHAPPPSLLIVRKTDDVMQKEVIEKINPPVVAALLVAINYTLARWRPGYGPGGSGIPYPEPPYNPRERLDDLAAHMSRLITKPDPRFVGIMEDPGHNGDYLLRLRDQHLKTENKDRRDKLKAAAEKYWTDMGREIGMLPPKLPGGKHCTLDDRLLFNLVVQGEALVREVIGFKPGPEDLGAVRALIGKDLITPHQQAMLAELEEYPDRAKAYSERIVHTFDEKHETVSWTRRLYFPILYASEIRLVLRRWNAPRKREARYRAIATDLLAERLPITRKTLLKRISTVDK